MLSHHTATLRAPPPDTDVAVVDHTGPRLVTLSVVHGCGLSLLEDIGEKKVTWMTIKYSH